MSLFLTISKNLENFRKFYAFCIDIFTHKDYF